MVYLGGLVFYIRGDLCNPCTASNWFVFSSLLILGVFLVVRYKKVNTIYVGPVLLNVVGSVPLDAIARKVALLLADETTPFSSQATEFIC